MKDDSQTWLFVALGLIVASVIILLFTALPKSEKPDTPYELGQWYQNGLYQCRRVVSLKNELAGTMCVNPEGAIIYNWDD